MAALTADVKRSSTYPFEGGVNEPATSVVDTYYEGALIAYNTAGIPVVAVDTANFRFAGVNDKHVEVEKVAEPKHLFLVRGHRIWLPFTGAALTHRGELFHATSDNDIATGTGAGCTIGECIEVDVSNAMVLIDTTLRS